MCTSRVSLLTYSMLVFCSFSATAIPADRWVFHVENDLDDLVRLTVEFREELFQRFPVADIAIEEGSQVESVRITLMQSEATIQPGASAPVFRTNEEVKVSILRHTILSAIVSRFQITVDGIQYNVGAQQLEDLPICVLSRSPGYTEYNVLLSDLVQSTTRAVP